jgi:hypothetical protein
MEVRLSQQIDIAQNYNGQGDSNSALGARSKSTCDCVAGHNLR